ncbi:MAG: GTPase HflX [Candidatus Omnitrophica bacterium]|nr:GTPase HflX [Candidatus Omnitrophota bacterium]
MSKKLIEINSKEKAFLVVVDLKDRSLNDFVLQEEAKELEALVVSTGCSVSGSMVVVLNKINPALFIGKGKAEEISQEAWESNAKVVIFNVDLSSSQQRNLEDIIGMKTIDRTQLILDIFAQHAKSNAGKIQVELAQLEYLSPRLKGKGIILSRLGGGIGTRGPGEQKLEIERRRIEDRIFRLKKELIQLRKHREILRRKRKKEGFFLISLVGYTNAGKTTLLNALTHENQKTEEAFFTTLDPLSRILNLKEKVVIADTVGFIHDLPKKLIEAFKATLEELEYSDLLIHVADISRNNSQKLIFAVTRILNELGLKDKPLFYVFNKIDKVEDEVRARIARAYPEALFISAKKNEGLKEFKQRIEAKILEDFLDVKISVDCQDFEVLKFVYKNTQVLDSDYSSETKIRFNLRIRKDHFERLKKLISSQS